jgi:hypothetical protein
LACKTEVEGVMLSRLLMGLVVVALSASGQFIVRVPTSFTDNPDPSFRYITSSGAGSKTGTDWNNACDGFTGSCANASLVRGNTYYLAGGDYRSDGVLSFSKAASGTTRIILKKATITDHGTVTGFVAAYGDAQAVVGNLSFDTPYWTVDGQVGSGTTGYGFKVTPVVCTGAALVKGIDFGQNNSGMYVLHTEISMCGEDLLRDGTIGGPAFCEPDGACGLNQDGIYSVNFSATTDLQIRYVYIHDLTRDGITLNGIDTVLIEYTRIERNHGIDASSHGQGIAFILPPMSDVTVRYSVFADVVGTAALAWLGGNGLTYNNMYTYGNVLYNTDSARYTFSPSAIYGRVGVNQTNFLIYNNTFYNIVRPEPEMDGDTVSGIEIRNNVYVNSNFANNPSTTGVTSSHNFYYNNTGPFIPVGETGQQNGSSDPFVSAATHDFRLSAATNAGFTLSSPYNLDVLGLTRGADGTWDRGAYEKVP